MFKCLLFLFQYVPVYLWFITGKPLLSLLESHSPHRTVYRQSPQSSSKFMHVSVKVSHVVQSKHPLRRSTDSSLHFWMVLSSGLLDFSFCLWWGTRWIILRCDLSLQGLVLDSLSKHPWYYHSTSQVSFLKGQSTYLEKLGSTCFI